MKLHSILRAACILLLGAFTLHAEIPSLINYQGRLTDAQGDPVTGNRTMMVRVYDAPSGGNMTYEETIGTVAVANGTYSFRFGSGGDGVVGVLTGDDYLALSVNGTEESTRTRLLAVPYALKSADTQALSNQMAAISGNLSSLQSQNNAMTASLTALQSQSSSLGGNLSAVEGRAAELTGNMSSLLAAFRVISVSGNLSFGSQTVDAPAAHRQITLTNDGFARLTISGITFPAGFSGDWNGGTIAAGGSQSLTVTFTPTADQFYGGNITIDSDASAGLGSISCSGTGVLTRVITLSGNFSFGNLTVGFNATRTLAITNNGMGNLTIAEISLPTGFSGSWSGTIAPGATQNVDIEFSPAFAQSYGGNISVISDATAGGDSIGCSGTGIAPTQIIALGGNFVFGNVTLGFNPRRTLSITNIGTGNFTVSGISYPTGFSGNWSGTIAPGSTQNVTVIFSPTNLQSYGGNLSVASSAASGNGVLELSGVGVPVTPTMITVQGGTLPPNSALANQTVSTFLIGNCEVTWAEWKEVRDWAVNNGYTDLANVGAGSADNHPVRNVDWYEAIKWCNAKSEKEGLMPIYQTKNGTYKNGFEGFSLNNTANGYRLPREKEWEWAARGGIDSQGFIYSGSNDVNEVAWYYDNSAGLTWALGITGSRGTWPVGTKLANELGIYDMSGNVMEWCLDSHPSSSSKACRGGSWNANADIVAVAFRNWFNAGWGLEYHSFRLARNASP
jgi:sulfatase modifying factor 1